MLVRRISEDRDVLVLVDMAFPITLHDHFDIALCRRCRYRHNSMDQLLDAARLKFCSDKKGRRVDLAGSTSTEAPGRTAVILSDDRRRGSRNDICPKPHFRTEFATARAAGRRLLRTSPGNARAKRGCSSPTPAAWFPASYSGDPQSRWRCP